MDSPRGGADGVEIYCVCRSSDCSRFMIGCDKCNEWYHGDCIRLTQEEANFIKHFYCQLCREKNPSLKIKYKKKSREKEDKEWIREKKHKSDKHHKDHSRHDKHDKHKKHRHDKGKDKKGESSSHKHERVKERKLDFNDVLEMLKPKPEKTKEKNEESTAMLAPENVSEQKPLDVADLLPLVEPPSNHNMLSRSAAAKKSSRRCGECVACHIKEDCGRCDFCKDMRKFGGPNRIRQKCRLRQCMNMVRRKGISKILNQKAKAGELIMDDGAESDNDDLGPLGGVVLKSPAASKRARPGTDSKSPRKKDSKGKTKKEKKGQKTTKKTEGKKRSTKRKNEEDLEDVMVKVEDDLPRQCCGPRCIEPAREGSKYCSDECGMKLATNRIFEILPQRIQQWQNTQCIAEEKNKLSLETIRGQQLQARQKLVELDMKHKELDTLIERAKHATADSDQDNTEGDEEGENTIHCVTCGHEIAQRTALKHMERCFGRFESQTSFGSIYKTKIEGNSMFCDFYNIQAKTYCKRLKVLCPEHSKEPKTLPDEVCGCPLVINVFEYTGEFCQTQKTKCTKHYCWEKLRRAEIDMERVRQWMKLDELFEQERNIRMAMSSRAGVLGLMLHQTIDHNPMKPIKPGLMAKK